MHNSVNNNNSEDDNDEECVMHSKSDNIEIMISDEADEVIKKLFDSLKNRYMFVLVRLSLIKLSYFIINVIK